MDRSVLFMTCAVAFTVLLIHKFRRLRARWGSPRLWALCAAIFFTAITAWLSAPTTHHLVARATGIPNVAMPLVTTVHTVAGAAYLSLALLWRYPARTAWRRLRWIFLACVMAIVVMLVLFSVSSVPEERTSDFAIYYVNQPTVAAFVMIWWICTLGTRGTSAYWCFAWSQHPDYADVPWLRWSLRLYGAVGADVATLGVVGIATLTAHWFGSSALDPLYKAFPPVDTTVAVVLLIAALTAPTWGRWLPVVGRWTSQWRIVFVLRPLHRALRQVEPTLVFIARGRRLDPHHRTRRMMIELSDWRWILAPLFNDAVDENARLLGRKANLAAEELAATVEAAQLKAAAHAWKRGSPAINGDDAQRHAVHAESARDGAMDAEVTWWVQVSRAFRKSPVVAEALSQHLDDSPATERPPRVSGLPDCTEIPPGGSATTHAHSDSSSK